MTHSQTVDEYIERAQEDSREQLKQLRALIKENIPAEAEEMISYGIPLYKYHGHLIGFGGYKNHIALYIINGGIREQFKDELKDYKQEKSTIHFPIGEDLPVALIKKIIKQRVKENEELKK